MGFNRAVLWAGPLLLGGILIPRSPVLAAEPVLLAEESSGFVEVDEETRVEVLAIEGEILLYGGKPGELRFHSSLTADRGDLPIALWLDDKTFRLLPVQNAPASRRVLEVGVPPGLRAVLTLSNSKITASGLQSPLELTGAKVEFQGVSLAGLTSLTLEDSKVKVREGTGGLQVHGRKVEAELGWMAGDLSLGVKSGRIDVNEAHGAIDADLEGCEVAISRVAGPVRVLMKGGGLVVSELALGGDFQLAGAPLKLSKSQGPTVVETDAAFDFVDTQASLSISASESVIH